MKKEGFNPNPPSNTPTVSSNTNIPSSLPLEASHLPSMTPYLSSSVAPSSWPSNDNIPVTTHSNDNTLKYILGGLGAFGFVAIVIGLSFRWCREKLRSCMNFRRERDLPEYRKISQEEIESYKKQAEAEKAEKAAKTSAQTNINIVNELPPVRNLRRPLDIDTEELLPYRSSRSTENNIAQSPRTAVSPRKIVGASYRIEMPRISSFESQGYVGLTPKAVVMEEEAKKQAALQIRARVIQAEISLSPTRRSPVETTDPIPENLGEDETEELIKRRMESAQSRITAERLGGATGKEVHKALEYFGLK